ncbi:MAG: response regulator [Candidatus Eiseniibacteriota bacterium]|jgi:DNA-binding NtrC family response regulator
MDDKGLDILLVDDEAIVGKRLSAALEKNGHRVEIYDTGRAAIARLAERRFDIVVTDVRIDEIDGLDVLAAVQEHSPRTKTILITGYATVEVAREALAKGAFDFIAKPFRPQELRDVIDRAAKELATG